jgi:Domain of unknown function (DUF4260)
MRVARLLLHLEGAVVAAAAIWAYAMQTDGPWWLFVALWLAPDIGLLGFLADTRVGSWTYNPLHSYVGPIALVIAGIVLDREALLAVGLIWASHVGIDRASGYGLKSSWSARQTHLQQLTAPQRDGVDFRI